MKSKQLLSLVVVFLYKTSCLKIFFLLFSKKTKEKFRYYKNRIYICCEMKPKSF